MITRAECRKYFADCGLSYEMLDDADIAALQLMLSVKMKKCRKNPTGSYHSTWKMSKKVTIKHDTHGRVTEAYLRCIPYPGGDREAISFNMDGFIGFCGDFDDFNAEPILMTFIKWCRLLVGPGTCHDLAVTPEYRDRTEFKCSACGYEYSAIGGFGCDQGDEPDFNFCPNCGRKVVDE